MEQFAIIKESCLYPRDCKNVCQQQQLVNVYSPNKLYKKQYQNMKVYGVPKTILLCVVVVKFSVHSIQVIQNKIFQFLQPLKSKLQQDPILNFIKSYQQEYQNMTIDYVWCYLFPTLFYNMQQQQQQQYNFLCCFFPQFSIHSVGPFQIRFECLQSLKQKLQQDPISNFTYSYIDIQVTTQLWLSVFFFPRKKKLRMLE
eukprot:TRINITY_DN11446_c0_g1_i4.p1 TRINITY_DN11446_c0_g1~~TRINITY_DN11446_c0_g1_i4.p1  ORF type:complete len:199 (-),score=-9.12 TRINITY_DN11446_c0_g1_i4:85-681(-)